MLDKDSYFNITDMQDYVDWLAGWHAGEMRKGLPLPYVVHPIRVMRRLMEWGLAGKDLLYAAGAHDLLEDTDITLDELKARIGDEAVVLVQELTHDPAKQKKTDYLKSFKHKSNAALVIKMADRIDNAWDTQMTRPKALGRYIWTTSAPLFDIWFNRKEELSTKDISFGGAVYQAICAEVELLRSWTRLIKQYT